jgi:5-formyltetrahydrofolate cyclo-ligase
MRAVARPDSRFAYDLTSFIPDFPGSELFRSKLGDLPCYQGDGPVFVTPDNCLQDLKAGLIASGRPLLQTVAVAIGFHYIPPGRVAPGDARFAGTLDGALLLAEKLDLDAVRRLGPLDFVVTVETGLTPSPHDTAGDWILTPARTIHVPDRHLNPTGVRWDIVDAQRLADIEPLRQLAAARRSAAPEAR